MVHPPKAAGLVLYQRVQVDPEIGETSLMGLFQARSYHRFPTLPQEFGVYAALSDGMGEGVVELRMSHLESADDLFVFRRWTVFSNRLQTIHLIVPVKRCVFPEAGRYCFELRFEDHFIADRAFDVFDLKPKE